MGLTASDIRFFFSGGLTNNSAENSLGGEISAFWITNNRLFSDVSPEEAEDGKIDYRCIYLNNLSENDTLFDAAIFLENEVEGGAVVTIGTIVENARQDVVITNGTLVTGGSFVLSYYDPLSEDLDNLFEVVWQPDLNDWVANFELAIRAIPALEEVVVTASSSGTTVTFRIDFEGTAGNRFHSLLGVVGLGLISDSSYAITPTQITSGGPIMLTADEISSEVVPPNGIIFSSPTISNPIEISDLNPGEYLPIWLKRVVNSSTTAIEDDGFRLRLRGEVVS